MSITLEIVTETNYKNFLKDWEPSETYSEYEDRWDEATEVYTNFSGNTSRIYKNGLRKPGVSTPG